MLRFWSLQCEQNQMITKRVSRPSVNSMADSLLIEEPHPYIEDVAASVIVEPTAVGGGGGPGTLPAAAMQFADLTESGSESGDDVSSGPHLQPSSQQQQQQQQQTQQQQQLQQQQLEHGSSGRSSPPPNCAICLSRCRRKCFTDSCMHQFCFKCLCEWSKIKAECPLCKQPFKTIIHNVRTLDDYDRYPVQSNTPEHSSVSFHIVNIRRQRYLNQGVLTNDIDAGATDDSLDGLLPHPTRMQGPFNRFEPYRTELLNFYRHDQDAGGSGSLSQLWRRYVYDRKLYALPVCDSLTGQFREWSARFYRDNPAQMHRLMPWINRDIVCLLRNLPQNVSEVMQLMHDILPMINIPTRTFRRRLTPYLGERTNHFIHELFNFARSPYDMVGYDRVVQYSARVAEEVEVDLLDLVSGNNEGSAATATEGNGGGVGVGGGGDGAVNASAEAVSEWSRLPRPSTSVIVTNPSATHSFSVTMATDGSELPGISIRRTTTSNVGSQTVAINLSMRRPANEIIEIGDDGDAEANAEVAAINDGTGQTGRRQAGASLPISAHIELQSSDCSNSSDDDECVFVLERKPPHLRTPELVSLDSNSDSDVVFVDEQRPQTSSSSPAKATDAAAGAREAANAEASIDDSVPSELFMGPSTSTGVCSNSHSRWMVVRRKDLLQRNGLPKRHATRSQHRHSQVAAAAGGFSSSSSSGSSGANWINSSSSSSSEDSSDESNVKLRKRRPARKTKTRKRVARTNSSNKFKNKRRRKQQQQQPVEDDDEDADEPPRLRMPSRSKSKSNDRNDNNNSSSSGDESSDAAGNKAKRKRNNVSSSSNDESNSSDDDSSDNLKLSTLREHIKIELKPHKNELKAEQPEEPEAEAGAEEAVEQQQNHHTAEPLLNIKSSMRKRRRSCNSNSSQLSNLSSHSNSQSVNSSTLASQCNTMSSCSPLSLSLTNNSDGNAPSRMAMHYHSATLIGLPDGSADRADSEQSEATVSYLHTSTSTSSRRQRTVDEEAQLGIYSDGSNDDFIIDVVREAESSLLNESVEGEPEVQQQQQQQQQREQQAEAVEQPSVAYEEEDHGEDEEEEEEDDDDEDDEDEPEHDQEQDDDATDDAEDAEDSPAPDTEASDSELDATDAY
ncbi:PREDICTED: E3 ubiquitin-protein ligase Topors isoform X1 [Drosophila arizonae]|uniref:RING-type E3 ubiquitin transferase n=2 Tax=Drosophila arizonae TaxID=7263 RepID=A0ABM1PLF8_DROAR|nr:PREDICTED: E3 ubiquitin-protein ligase Topors isoform X1 [Drosophila arizonae]